MKKLMKKNIDLGLGKLMNHITRGDENLSSPNKSAASASKPLKSKQIGLPPSGNNKKLVSEDPEAPRGKLKVIKVRDKE